jgi:ribose 5-phosphate isomerase B
LSVYPQRIAIGSDHAGFALKEALKILLAQKKIPVNDLGTHSEDSCDYPDFAFAVANHVSKGLAEAGILVCGTGIGMSMAANKVRGVRAAVAHSVFTAKMAAAHNHANVLCLGARVVEEPLAREIVEAWLEEPREKGRHERRVEKINQLEPR